jgi:protoporphyrin/coproporphyrin ferrochelatase
MRDPVLLVNMGGPADVSQVRDYLRAIFLDPAILPVPGIVRGPLAGLISARRSSIVSRRYERIGGGSPLLYWTQQLRMQTEQAIHESGLDTPVYYAFRYSGPTIEETLNMIHVAGHSTIRLFPLFPHFTRAMTGSIERECRRVAGRFAMSVQSTSAWWNHEAVIELWSSYLAQSLESAGPGARVLFVAHGIPERNVRQGEDYPEQVRATAQSIAKSLELTAEWSIAFQSKVGPVAWTKPYLENEITRLAASSAPLVIMPLSFVADCLETIYDLDLIAAQRARDLGITRVVRVPAFNDDPRFARAVVSIMAEKAYVC